MTVVIQVAMPAEAAPFIAAADSSEPVVCPLAGVDARRMRVAGQDVVLVTSGIGLVAAAAAASWAVLTFAPRALVSAGTAGGLAPASRVGDVAVGLDYSYGTADATEFDYERGQVPGQPVRFAASDVLLDALGARGREPGSREERDGSGTLYGRILSGDTFVTARNVADMREAFADAVATDMESCAIAQVCRAFAVPFVSVRGVSDLCGPEAGVDHHLSVDATSQRAADAVLAFIGKIEIN